MLDNVHYPHAIKFPSPEITHLTSIAPDRGYSIVVESTAGSPAPCFVGVGSANPRIDFSSRQLKSILDLLVVSADHPFLLKDLSAGTVDLWYRAGKPMDLREDSSTAKHIVCRLALSSMLTWSQIRVTQGSIAEIECSLATAKRSANTPMIWLGSQTLPSAAGCQRIYGMGPVRMNGVLLKGVSGWTMSSGTQLETIMSDGDKSPSYQGVANYHPIVSLNSNDLTEITNSSFGGDGFNTLEMWLQRMSSTDMFDPPGSTTHILITVYGGLRTVAGVSGIGAASLSPTFHSVKGTILPTHTINTSSSIT